LFTGVIQSFVRSGAMVRKVLKVRDLKKLVFYRKKLGIGSTEKCQMSLEGEYRKSTFSLIDSDICDIIGISGNWLETK
jgi:hypothetical protein